MPLQADIIKQIDAILAKHAELRSRSKWEDCSDQPTQAITAVAALMCDAISRFAPTNSQYLEGMRSLVRDFGISSAGIIAPLAGILAALKIAYESGYLNQVSTLIHADMFSNFIEMATYLLSEGWKDPAAVIVGSSLEEHLRQLCNSHNIPVDVGGRPKKADQLNADLAGSNVYSKLDQKAVTSWLDLRNKAAHGKYSDYTKDQVGLLIQGIQNFMLRNPA